MDVEQALDDLEAIDRKYPLRQNAQRASRVVTDGYYGSAHVPIADIQRAGSHVLRDGGDNGPGTGSLRGRSSLGLLGSHDRPGLHNHGQLFQSTRLLDPRNNPHASDFDSPEVVRQKNQQKLEQLRDYHQNRMDNGALEREFQHVDGPTSLR